MGIVKITKLTKNFSRKCLVRPHPNSVKKQSQNYLSCTSQDICMIFKIKGAFNMEFVGLIGHRDACYYESSL